jgi:hypothetical protein
VQLPQAAALSPSFTRVNIHAFDLYSYIFGMGFVEGTVFAGTFIVMDSEKDACGIPIKTPARRHAED